MDFKKLNPKNKKTNAPQSGLVEKIQAIINLIQLGGGMVMPKVGGKIILLLLFLLICFSITGAGTSIYWFIQLVKFIF